MTNPPEISVILPAYNVEKYLRQCLDSIINQTYENIEIICVNDASTDNTLSIFNEYAQKDKRIIVIDKKINEGVEQARKTALERSKGKYVIMIDSDDSIELNMLEIMYNEAIAQNCDMVSCGYFEEKNGKTIAVKAAPFSENKIERIRFICFGYQDGVNMTQLGYSQMSAIVVWNKLIKREICENLVFSKYGFGGDQLVSCQTAYYSEKICSVPQYLYHYQIRENSITTNFGRGIEKDTRIRLEWKTNFLHIIKFCEENLGEDFREIENELKGRIATIGDIISSTKSVVVQEFEILLDFLVNQPKEVIKEGANYIFERIKLNLEKIKNTDEEYLSAGFMDIQMYAQKIISAQNCFPLPQKILRLISVILPVYNVEEYLRQCLDSIVNQTYKNIEIICVNDASTDNSLSILNEYAQIDKRIIVIDKKVNEGVEQARKTALEHSKGKYIIMVDSDDWLELNMLEIMYKNAFAQNCDMVSCGYFQEYCGTTKSIKAPNFPQNKIGRIMAICFGELDDIETGTRIKEFKPPYIAVWNKLIKREIYEKVVFSKYGYSGDDFVSCQTSYYSEKICSVSQNLYHYRIRENSITTSLGHGVEKNMRIYNESKSNYAHIIKFCQEKFKEDFRFLEYNFKVKQVGIETINPNKSVVIQEIELLSEFLRESPKEAIKEAQNYIAERVELNLEKIKNTDEEYFSFAFKDILKYMQNAIKTETLKKTNIDKISVIIPAYNVEKYLRQCLESIINQTYENIEIICVNDASTDNTLSIFNEYAQKDKRIIVIDKKVNEGVEQARKTALERSTGKYVIMVDSDDYAELTMLEKMCEEMCAQNCDMVICGYFVENVENVSVVNAPPFPQDKIERIKFVCFGAKNISETKQLGYNLMSVIVVWNKLVKREIYEKVVFSNYAFYGDQLVVCQTSYYSEKICSIQENLYHYRIRENSDSSSSAEKAERFYREWKTNIAHIIKFCKEKLVDDFRIVEQDFSRKIIECETMNPNKSVVVQEFEILLNFLKESPKEAIKEAQNYIAERVKLNLE
ncbi:MAG: glycosyltransferase, partial [Chitinivibrionia bacterium]|nr:glycosyltransferase [Chitinivibrionia bacterium]